MTELEAVRQVLERAVAEVDAQWAVAIAAPAGHAGPCASIVSWEESRGNRSSLTEYPVIQLEIEIQNLREADIAQARRCLQRVADLLWTSRQMRAISGQLTRFVYARSEDARHELWTATGTVQYQVAVTEDA